MSFSKHSSLYHKITFLSLFAILLITFGPVISQVQAMLLVNNPPIHHQANISLKESHPKATSLDEQQKPTTPSPHHLMPQCGYCDLLHYTPVINFYTPLIARAPPLRQAISPLPLVDYLSPSYNKALSRAPPFN